MIVKNKIIDEGAESIVTLVVLDDGTSVVTKTRQPNGKTQYLFEAFSYESVGRLGSHVPTVVSVDENQLTMSAFVGETIDDQTDLYDDTEIFEHIAKDLALNKQVVFKCYGKPILSGVTYSGEYAEWVDFLNTTYEKLKKSHLLTKIQKESLTSKWKEMIINIRLDQGSLVHGDFALSAIFVNNNKYEGIIDYGDAFVGDPLLDLAYFRFKEITKDYGHHLYDMLAGAYAEHSDIDREYIDYATTFYMMYWAIERIHTDNLEDEIIQKFIEKTQALIDYLSGNYTL